MAPSADGRLDLMGWWRSNSASSDGVVRRGDEARCQQRKEQVYRDGGVECRAYGNRDCDTGENEDVFEPVVGSCYCDVVR